MEEGNGLISELEIVLLSLEVELFVCDCDGLFFGGNVGEEGSDMGVGGGAFFESFKEERVSVYLVIYKYRYCY